MENKPKIFCDKCHKFVEYVARAGEFFFLRDEEYYYCKDCKEAREARKSK